MEQKRDAGGGQQRSTSRLMPIVLVVTIVIVFVLVLGRFTLFNGKSSEGPSLAQAGTAQPIATATPVPGGGAQVTGNTVIPGATPLPTAIIQGAPNPSQDTAYEQQLRAEDGNPSKVIMISIQGQFIQAFQNGKLIRWDYVTTGRPGMDTPTGFFDIFYKQSPFEFTPISTDPNSIWFEYASMVNYAMAFAPGGYYIHDVWWRTIYGPGTQVYSWDPGREQTNTGSHGCVNTPLEMEAWLYTWTPLGTPVIVF
jgi:lipoprotein-anchoring transpeptidase ErfK/SrfK